MSSRMPDLDVCHGLWSITEGELYRLDQANVRHGKPWPQTRQLLKEKAADTDVLEAD